MGLFGGVTARDGDGRAWQSWTPYAALAWSAAYAVLGAYWALAGRGFPYDPEMVSGASASVVGRLGPLVAWAVVMAAGVPAMAVGTAMLRGLRLLRSLLVTTGALLATVLLLFMTDLDLLVMLAYVPYVVFRLLTGAEIGFYLQALTQSRWVMAHQGLCLIGGFLWLGATVSYARRTGGACLYCGRRDGPEGWNSPDRARRWGRIAAYVALVPPVVYAVTRYAWALGIPLGISEAYLRLGQARGIWTSGLFLATFGLVGAALTLGLVQRWGEVFPRWMIGLAGRRVPIALAVVPASVVSVLLMVSGISLSTFFGQVIVEARSGAAATADVVTLAPTALFPVWGAALAVATLGYYYRRRGPCRVCGRGAYGVIGKPRSSRTLDG